MIDPSAAYTPAEAAAAIHAAVKPGTITAAVKAGKIPHIRLGRVILIQGSDLEHWVQTCKEDHSRAPSYSARTTSTAQSRARNFAVMSGMSSGERTECDASSRLALNTAKALKAR